MERNPKFRAAFFVHVLTACLGLGLLGWMVFHDAWTKTEQQWFFGILTIGLAGRLAAEWGYRQIKSDWRRRRGPIQQPSSQE